MVGAVVALNDVLWPSLQSMLANDDRALFIGLQVTRQEQYSVGDDVWENIEDYFVAHPFFCVVDFSATRIERQSFAIEATDHIVVKLCAIFFVRRLKLGHGRRVRFVELLSHERALAEQPLCVTVNLMKLRRVARGCIEFFPEVRDVVFSRLAKRCVCSKRLEKLAKRLAGQRFLSTLNQSQLGRRFELFDKPLGACQFLFDGAKRRSHDT